MSRISDNMTFRTVNNSINKTRLRMSDYQRKNATMKNVNKPSDDPVGNTKLMQIRNEELDNERYQKNAEFARTFLNYTDSALEEMTEALVRARELAVQAASTATSSADSRIMVAEEIKHIIGQTYGIANRKLGNRYIFSGYQTDTQPFDNRGNYSGDDGKIMIEIQKDVFVSMNMPGDEVFSGEQRRTNAQGELDQHFDGEKKERGFGEQDIFRTLEALRTGLMTNDSSLIRSTLDPLENLMQRVVSARATVGSRLQGLDSAISSIDNRTVFNSELKSQIEDANIVDVVSAIAREETALKASLGASAKMIQPSLLEFLR